MQFPGYTHKKARIEIVPMIDTIFFLLVYFMIASLSESQTPARPVALPLSTTVTRHVDAMIVVTIMRTGQLYVGDTSISLKDLKSDLLNQLSQNNTQTVLINCDRNQSVALFNQVFDVIKQSNPTSVMVATTPRTDVRVVQ